MRVLFVGDVHNHKYIFDDIKRLDNKYDFDRVIFFGDYVDDWNTTNHQSLETLEKVINLKNINPEKYTLLWGNHENSYAGYKCSGHRFELDDVVELKLKDNIDLFDFYTIVKCGEIEYVCTHAGITNDYVNKVLNGKDHWRETIEIFNKNKLKNLDMTALCNYIRGGSDECSSFLWADKREHLYYASFEEPIIKYQIVGHTPVENISLVNNIFYIDTHSTYRNGDAYGDKSYLIWDDRGFIIDV